MNAIHSVLLLWAISCLVLAYEKNRHEHRLGKLESKLEWRLDQLERKLDECIAARVE